MSMNKGNEKRRQALLEAIEGAEMWRKVDSNIANEDWASAVSDLQTSLSYVVEALRAIAQEAGDE